MDEHQAESPTTSLDHALLEEETRERQEEIRKMLRREERRGLKMFGRAVGWTFGAAALAVFIIDGINYLANERAYTRYDSTRVESHVTGFLVHERVERRSDGSVVFSTYTPFEHVTTRSYIDSDGDGDVDMVWQATTSHPLYGTRGVLFTRGEPSIPFDDADRRFAEGLSRFRGQGSDPR